MRLETFVKKNDLSLEFVKTTRVFTPGTGAETEWKAILQAPVLARYLRVTHKSKKHVSTTTLFPFRANTKKEARQQLIDFICGGELAYSNAFDRMCGQDEKIKVPKDLS